MDLEKYVELGLIHSIHTSERKSFRACRRRWHWAYRQGYHPKVTPRPLEFGIAIHAAFEAWYDPEKWLGDRQKQSLVAISTFKQVVIEQLMRYRELNGELNDEVLADYEERVDLGVKMLEYYTRRVSPVLDKDLTPLAVEIPFEVPLGIWCTCTECWDRWCAWQDKNDPVGSAQGPDKSVWKGLPLTFGGRIDAIFQDNAGRILVVDWKPQPIDSPILTPSGWVKMGNLKVGDEVVSSNGTPTTVIGVYPKTEMEVYEVEFFDGTVVECSKDHAWAVTSTIDTTRKIRILETHELANKKYYENYRVQLPSAPIEFNKSDNLLPIHPYILGALIGDGSFVNSVLMFSSQSGETVELIKKYIPNNVIITDKRAFGSNSWQIDGPYRQILKDLGLWNKKSGDKFIPKEYLFSSVEDRILLLQGLADTDGNTGLLRITTTSSKLAEDIRHLIWSLGGISNLSKSKQRMHQNGHTINVPQYGINYWLPTTIEPNQLIRKRQGRKPRTRGFHRAIKSITATGKFKKMQCIRVDSNDNLYMTNNFILTHNTTSRILDDYDESAFLELDDQVGGYVAALARLGRQVDGFIYHEQRKAVPEDPKPLKRPYKGRLFSTNRTEPVEYASFVNVVMKDDFLAYQAGAYDEYLEFLSGPMKPKFYQRHTIFKTNIQIDNFWNDLTNEAQDMTQDPRVYPQPSRFSCGSCMYRTPCEGQNRGEDYLYTLESLFTEDKP